ncbi:hypothetical protein JN11_00507 [Mucilaginibacter frigoritolerans]|uniref:Aspartyl protease n=1 Tax=Mucilaginibacter frigoritolerans TaxID=652788 RepID=A0A562UG20_9SPHI|nr:hypothetical protein [Mucilaginibacter frigoritolerans]TWJ04786.1 hypothetical protein JN11_00507 [Mucilaginibacter frigoritolerans]
MVKIYSFKNLSFILVSLSLLALASCKKEHHTTVATPTKLGLYAYSSSIYKELGIVISKVGTQNLDSLLVFDTGSGGMVIDATNILPASMISTSGFVFTGDSTVVDGITLTNQTSSIAYGVDSATTETVYGNLAYASVTIGDENGSIVIKRLPFFLYYKAVDSQNNILPAHEFDVFGVSSEYDLQFSNNVNITSPFSYFDPGTGLTKGFKMSAIGTSDYSYLGTYVDALTLGLTSDDLSGSSGFSFATLSYYQGDGYAPVIPGTVTYNNKSFASYVLFDTGTEPYSYLEDPTYAGSGTNLLPTNSAVSVSTTSGFTYSYVTSATENLTNVENPGTANGNETVFGLEFFLNNEYMIDFTDHKLGLKNN